MACRFPGNVNNIADFHDAVMNKSDFMGGIPIARWDSDSITSQFPSTERGLLHGIRCCKPKV